MQRLTNLAAQVISLVTAANDSAVRLIDEPYAAFVDLKFRSPDKADALLREDAICWTVLRSSSMQTCNVEPGTRDG